MAAKSPSRPIRLITPLARDAAEQRGIRIRVEQPKSEAASSNYAKVVALGADHGGFALKEQLKTYLRDWGYTPLDLGTSSTEAVDYPDFAEAVANAVARGDAWRGVVVDSAGIGSSIAANKVPGARAALCYDRASARNSREHNDANIMTSRRAHDFRGNRPRNSGRLARNAIRRRPTPKPNKQDSSHRVQASKAKERVTSIAVKPS